MSDPKKIMVLKLRHLGDVLLTTPVFRALREKFPGAELLAGVNAGTEAILKGSPLVARSLAVPVRSRAAGGLAHLRAEIALVRQLRGERLDLVADLTGSDRSAILTRLSGAPMRWGYHRKKGFLGRNGLYTGSTRRKPGVHVIEQQAAFLEHFGVPTRSTRLEFAFSAADAQRVASLLPSGPALVHVHPVSRVMEKCWPAHFLAEYLDRLARRGFLPVLTASRDETERAWVRELLSKMSARAIDLSGQLTLQELGALSSRARLFLGVDSAPMHMAAAVGTPVIGIFGPSSEVLWGPWCERKLILSRDLSCRLPCQNKQACPHHDCLRAMTVEMVWPRTESFLSELAPAGGAL
jgi:heptosyltransferase-3